MVKKPFKGKYLTLENVRVSYDEKTDTIHLTSKDKDLPMQCGFHLVLNKGKEAEWVLRDLLEDKGLIPKEKSRNIASHAHLNDAITIDKWDKFPLGLLPNEQEAVWDSSHSNNLLLAGHTGSGKSVIQRNIIFHCLRHPKNWVFFGIDLKQVELVPYLKFGAPITGVATTLADAHTIVTNAHDEMYRRYQLLEQNNVNHFRDLADSPPAWMMMIDESAMLLSESPYKTDAGQSENLLKTEIGDKLFKIAQLGRAAGIHIVMATQRIDSTIFPYSFRENFDARIAAGGMNSQASQLLLDNDKATLLNRAIKGRGYFQQNGQGSDFQGYFSEFHWPYDAGIVSK